MLSRNLWTIDDGLGLDVFARTFCACKAAQIRHIQMNIYWRHRSARDQYHPWELVVGAASKLSSLRLAIVRVNSNGSAGRAEADAEYIAKQRKKFWTGFVCAMKGTVHLEKAYVSSECERLPLKDGNEGPLTSHLCGNFLFTSADGLGNWYNEKIFDGKGRELDLQKEIDYWQNWENIAEEEYSMELNGWHLQWIANPCKDAHSIDSDDNVEEDSDEEDAQVE